ALSAVGGALAALDMLSFTLLIPIFGLLALIGIIRLIRNKVRAAAAVVALCAAFFARAVPLETPYRGMLGTDPENAVVVKSETAIHYARNGRSRSYHAIVEIKKTGAYGIPSYWHKLFDPDGNTSIGAITDYAVSPNGFSLQNGFFHVAEEALTNGVVVSDTVRFAGVAQPGIETVPFFYAEKTGRYKFTLNHNWHIPKDYTPGDISTGLKYRFHPFMSADATVAIRFPDIYEITCDALAGIIVESDGGETVARARIPQDAPDEFGVIRYSFARRSVDPATLPVLMSAKMDTTATVRHGFVEMKIAADFNLLQGVAKTYEIKIPEPFVVTGATVNEWAFDYETRVFSANASVLRTKTDFALNCSALVQNLPYTLAFEMPQALGVTAQNATFTLASDAAVTVSVAESEGMESVGARKFQYGADARVTLAAESVKPEIRATVEQSVSLGDERIVVSANTQIEVSKAGIFSVGIEVPEGYAIDTLSGDAVASFDDARKAGGGVTVSFSKEVTGKTRIFAALSKSNGGVLAAETFPVPRIAIADARRQTGTVNITAERGTRLALTQGKGVEAVQVADISASRRGNVVSLTTSRPDWEAALSVRVMAPVIRSELLQTVSVSEGIVQHKAHLRFTIENSGAKQFRLLVPVKGASVSVTGKRIARVAQVDDDETADGSVWLIELEGKAEGEYVATVFFQEQANGAGAKILARPVQVIGAERQTGWMAVFGQNRVKVDAVAVGGQLSGGLRSEDARSIPDVFGAGLDVASAIGAWKITDPAAAALELSVTRHDAAQVLPAEVRSVANTSVVSLGGRVLTSTRVRLSPGKMRFLRVALPSAEAEFWTAQVDGISVTVSKEDGGVMCVPLDGAAANEEAEVVLVWGDRIASKLSGTIRLASPRFPDLPLKNISWQVYSPEGKTAKIINDDFDEAQAVAAYGKFDQAAYMLGNNGASLISVNKAINELSKANRMLEQGQMQESQIMFQNAWNWSQNDIDLNEDARVQFERVFSDNAGIAFKSRQSQVRAFNNIFEAQETTSADDELDAVSGRIIRQQISAAKPATAIMVALPEEGVSRTYTRALQSEPGGAMTLELKFTRDFSTTAFGKISRSQTLWASVILFPVAWLLFAFAFGSRKRD
ncbi:MAG: hypothetical protein FWG05_02985, partial [Kiritimatiellaeota bacterium]|nr:hypothetical protein [Kiritimatiellota bacterium]